MIRGVAGRLLIGLAAAVLAGAVSAAEATSAVGATAVEGPPIRHVFLIVLENESFDTTFGPHSPAPYLARTLASQGLLLTRYYAIGHNSLGNYVALVSGQAPNDDTQADCLRYADFSPRAPRLDAHGQAIGRGCVYPASVRTLPDQLEAAGLTWKGYMEDMGNDPRRERRTCGRPRLDEPDPLQFAARGDEYASKHDPFIYFHSIVDDAARCDAHVVPLSELARDLESEQTTPNYVFVTPNLCHDGHDVPCIDGEPGGLRSIDGFLREWVPRITSSSAFRRDGLLIVTFDEAGAQRADMAAACCHEQPLPGTRFPPGLVGPGGGRIGALLLSPLVRGGATDDTPLNHYALLRGIEAIFGLPALGYAADPALNPLPGLPRSAATAPRAAARAAGR
jgi:phosphatidylinositol-3-phosphatase